MHSHIRPGVLTRISRFAAHTHGQNGMGSVQYCEIEKLPRHDVDNEHSCGFIVKVEAFYFVS